MAVQSNRQTLVRQWEMLKLLPTRQPGVTARKITEQLNSSGFAVSKRQIERDLDLLSQSFAIVCNDRGKPYGWHWMEGAGADIPAVSAAEALSLSMVEKILTPLVPSTVLDAIAPRLNQAKDKLAKLQPYNDLVSWQEKVAYVPATLQQKGPIISDRILRIVQIALLRSQCIKVTYSPVSRHSETKQYTLHPLSIVQRGVTTYLAAKVEPYDDVRLFVIHRMDDVEILEDKKTVIPEGFSLKNYLEQGALHFSDGNKMRLRALIHEELAGHLEEAPLSEDQVISKTKQVIKLEVTITDSWHLRWWILSQGDKIEVIEPQTLRSEIKSTLERAAKPYQ